MNTEERVAIVISCKLTLELPEFCAPMSLAGLKLIVIVQKLGFSLRIALTDSTLSPDIRGHPILLLSCTKPVR